MYMSQSNLLLLHVHLQAWNTMWHGSCPDRQQGVGATGGISEFLVSFQCLPHAFLGVDFSWL